ncbi:MAG: 50S ribosomal protein L17 [Kiritimatiellae bacterium]|nr:50S ribosomal protein L17 [Kiritimatiellia bacterium]
MRHQRVMKKFGRSMEHRKMLMRSLVSNLILAESIKTTLPKAKEARKDADKMVTIAKKDTLAARRLAASRLVSPEAVQKLFAKIAPAMKERQGGYTRIVKLGTRKGDGAEMCVLAWVTAAEAAPAKEEPAKEVK